ncbi:antitoxin VbhA family protein [Corynebacterium evansiae]
MTADNRTEDQKVAAVRASMTMEGYEMTTRDEEDVRRILRGEITGDEAVLEVLERHGLGDSEPAKELRERIAESKKEGQTGKSDDLTDNA